MQSTGTDQKLKSAALLPFTHPASAPERGEVDSRGLQETRSVKLGEYLHPRPTLIRRHLQFETDKGHGVGFATCVGAGERRLPTATFLGAHIDLTVL